MTNLRRFLLVLLLIVTGMGVALYRPDIPVETLRRMYASPISTFIDIDGMPVHYRMEGNPADSIPLLLIHGTSSSLLTWDAWVSALKNDHKLIRLDLPGYALTGPPMPGSAGFDTITADYYARFLSDFLNRLAVKRCDVAGNSLGGNIAWHLALRDPGRVRKLILIDASGYPFTPKSIPIGFRLAQIPGLGGLLANLTPDGLFRSSLKNVYADDTKVTEILVRQYADMTRRTGNRHWFVTRKTPLDSAWQQIGQIRQPTLLLWGQQDDLIPVAVAGRFHHDLPHDTLIVYPNAGHVPMEEIPAQTVADARAFLRK